MKVNYSDVKQQDIELAEIDDIGLQDNLKIYRLGRGMVITLVLLLIISPRCSGLVFGLHPSTVIGFIRTEYRCCKLTSTNL
jgi:hypothetical protein